MSSSLFREKSLEKNKTPEKLDEYIRVTSPALWLIISAIVVLLIGFFIWGALGTIETKTTVAAAVVDGQAVCRGDSELIRNVRKDLDSGREIIFEMGEKKGVITSVDEEEGLIYGEIDAENGSGVAFICEEIRPISLLFD